MLITRSFRPDTQCCVDVLRYTVILLIILWGALAATAQEQPLTQSEIEAQIEALDASSALTEEDQARIDDLLSEARAELDSAEERQEEVDGYMETVANSGDILERIAQSRIDIDDPVAPADLPETSAGLRSRLDFLQAERSARASQRNSQLELQADLAGRAAAIAEDITFARQALSELRDTRDVGDSDESSDLERAREALLRARIFSRRSQVEQLQRELQTIPDRQSVVSARIALANEEIAALDAEIVQIQQRLSDVRMDRADAALSRAQQGQLAAQDLPPPAAAIAAETVELATTLRDMADRALAIEQDIKLRTEQTLEIRQQADTVERILATGRITDEVGALLRQLRASLPRAQILRESISEAVEARASTQLSLILWQDRLRLVRAIEWPEPESDPEPEPDTEPGTSDETETDSGPPLADPLDELIDLRESLLEDLIAAGRDQSDRLTDKEIAVRETLTEMEDLRGTLERRLLWLPSNVRPLSNWWPSVQSSLDWMFSQDTVSAAADEYAERVRARPLPLIVGIALVLAAFAGRRRLLTIVADLNADVGKIPRDKYYTTPLAIFACVVLSSPLPLALIVIALPILLNGEASPFLTAFANGCLALSATTFMVLTLLNLSRPDGVFETHFNWSERAIRALRRPPVWSFILFCIAIFVTTAAVALERTDVQNGVGMVSFAIVSLATSIFGYATFDLDRGWIREAISDGMSAGLLLIGLIVFSFAPLVVGVMPFFGYFDTAIALQTRIVRTGAMLLAFALVYGVVHRLFIIAQRRLALRQAIARRAERAEERAKREEHGEEDEADDDGLSDLVSAADEVEHQRQRISNQTRRLLLYLSAGGALAGFLAIWATVLPALGVANEITLWTGTDTIDGVRAARPVTLWNLILFVLFIAAGIVAAYNIRGVLEVGPFQRLQLSKGSRYAIDTIIGYFLVGAGVVAGFLQLGLDWSRLQWIIAALGVGLGFGLQEIVANFISGLIILFERPVRVGDVVTIGDLDGTVTNVAIRATTVTDFDNREVILPNKSIITENVTNWTRRDSIMRIIVPIGVAYGSDVDAVRDLLLKIAVEENDVLETPEPRVFFMNHGDSSLDFEVRVFISNPRKRYRVRHELNTAINKALAQASIEIPFPQRDVHMKSG
ncbi:MAG: mechanosensitive ion channel domain-containing protein [Henriciella sp.]|uniref:mechanosensitive ion channel domain-containing protein n=1 Tax=Henriciella sp. TaxID=1968823 RepID=UPI003C769AF3